MKLIFELSGENPTLPFAELECIGTVTDQRLQVAVADCPDPKAALRLAMTQVVLEYLGECEPGLSAFRELLRKLALETTRPFAGRAKKVHGGCHERNPQSQREFERLIGTMISGPVSLKTPELEYRAILSEDRCYFGRVLFPINRAAYDSRNPGRRDFFHPGVMMPRMARALVNIACNSPGDIVLDPFCGTGGILIEAELLGMHTIGSDFDAFMIRGSRRNAKNTAFLLGDATSLPFGDNTVDSVVTDFPYGQSVCIRKSDTMDRLYGDALDEIRRVLRPGHRAVVVTHRDISSIAAHHMTILQQHSQRVHKSLTRRVLVLTQ
ncbi:MAG: methyltransferase domain-containing protein [Methanoregula sp.]|jgi:tRNA (guanine10-N2)-dimethyltransferase|uniref:methyltransferase domain-containing protein n=1 Tax=Methanoregula sp. TaxID=2052170 RepID=UPI003C1B461F